MKWNFDNMLKLFMMDNNSKLLSKGQFGIEREAQRVTSNGNLALTPHPEVFGDKEENKYITTDFSESQIEIITPAFDSVEKVYSSLEELHLEVVKGIGDELLWPLSMPPRLPPEEQIPVAKFKPSVEGAERTAYRNGLALRYGKKMQMISGIHFNISYTEELVSLLYESFGGAKSLNAFRNDMYLSITRNFLRYRWLLIYLFGASPSCDETYIPIISRELEIIKQCCPQYIDIMGGFNQFATSLRVSRFGYSNAANSRYDVFYNSLEEYIRKINIMMTTKSQKYSKLFPKGFNYTDNLEGMPQLNGNILQKESEFYSPIRLKQNLKRGETQLEALGERGVKYLEIRILDVNPFDKCGISLEQMQFLQVFMLYCLFESSPEINRTELEIINVNHNLTALMGRKKDLLLYDKEQRLTSLKEIGEAIFIKLGYIAYLMDKATGDEKYLRCINHEYLKITNTSLLPSEIIHSEMKQSNIDFIEYGLGLTKKSEELQMIMKV